ncbi:MAG: IS1595 family transposase [Lachnospiraceae bacterium]|nr:IS1595 family transposase [Lachnospiraceae bacterium]
MALTNEELQDILSRLSTEEQKKLFEQLGKTFGNLGEAGQELPQPDTETKQPIDKADSKVYCCTKCGSANYKKNGFTRNGIQRYRCKDCGASFSENYGDSLRYTHLSESDWKEMLRGFIDCLSITKIANSTGHSTKTVWLAKQKVNQVIMTMYGYSELFQGTSQADEYYTRAAFKGKRDPEFFIYVLRRMPRHHRNYYEKIEWLEIAGLYEKLQREEPDYLAELLDDDPKMKRGISNDQICILTLVDDAGKLYLEPVSVGRLEKAMAKEKLKPKFIPDKSNVFVTDDHNAYNRILYGTQAKHEVVNSKQHARGKYSLAKVNSVHSALSRFMNPKEGKVFNTKHLDLTLMLFWWLYKYKDRTTDQKVKMLWDILNDDITDIEIRERVNQVTGSEIANREI